MTVERSVAILVVSYQTPNLTEVAVRSALADPLVTQVVVVDNASGDATLDRLAGIDDARLLTIANGRNCGFAVAANQACEAASSDYVVFLNSDAELRPGALEPLLRELDECGGRTIVGPRVLEPSGTVQRSAGLLPRPLDLVVRALELHHLASRIAGLPIVGRLLRSSTIGEEYATSISAIDATGTSMISGSCLAIGRLAFDEVGRFDERYFMYFEDADLCRRAALAGWPIRYVPAALVEHVGGASSSGDYHFGPLHGPAMVVYLLRWYGRAGGILALGLLAIRAVASTVTGRPGAQWARLAIVEGVRAYRRRRTRSPAPASVPNP